MLQLFTQAGWVAWPLGVCSVIALAIALERFFVLDRLRRLEESAFMMLQLGIEKDDEAMLTDPKISNSAIAQIVMDLRHHKGQSTHELEGAASVAISKQRLRVRRYLSTLASIGSTAPFIGLFGTVLGVMTAFHGMSKQGLSGEAMASGISEALSATALGLLVAIPAVLFYNALLGRANALMVLVQGHVVRLIPLLVGERQRQEV